MGQEGSSRSDTMTRRRFLAWAAVVGAVGLTGASVADAYRFGVVVQRVPLRGLRRPLRLALMADLHFGPYIGPRSVARWVTAVQQHAPDLIVLDGDIVDQHQRGDLEALLHELSSLEAPLGVYAVWGNHDHRRFADLTPFENDLRASGVELLVNRSVLVRDDLFLAGIDDFRLGSPDLPAALEARPEATPCVLLSHNPDVLPQVPVAVDLTLSGHTHGGQVRIPGIGALVTSSAYGQRFAQGWVKGPARGYVTRGLGVSLLPVRFDCPAELAILDLMPEQAVRETPSGSRT
jgi:hypothetical protein